MATKDAPTVARLRAAGAIVIGKTNTPEMTMDYDCDNPVFGQTNNPWNHERVPGGSSGGEAATLAAGMSPLGDGIRLSRIDPRAGALLRHRRAQADVGHDSRQRPHGAEHCVAAADRTHGDHRPDGALRRRLHARVQYRQGPASKLAYTVPTPTGSSFENRSEKIRCAIFTDACDVPVTADTRAAIERAGRELQKMGLVVEAVKPPVDEGERLWWAYNGADGNQLVTEALGEHLKLSRDRLRNFMVASEGKSAAEFFKIARSVTPGACSSPSSWSATRSSSARPSA